MDFVVCRAAFKNFSEPVKALSEMRRVLRPGGTAFLIDMRRDVKVEELKRYVDGLGVNLLNRWFMMVIFRGMLIKRAYRLEEIRRMAIEAGWVEPRIDSSPIGFEAWLTNQADAILPTVTLRHRNGTLGNAGSHMNRQSRHC